MKRTPIRNLMMAINATILILGLAWIPVGYAQFGLVSENPISSPKPTKQAQEVEPVKVKKTQQSTVPQGALLASSDLSSQEDDERQKEIDEILKQIAQWKGAKKNAENEIKKLKDAVGTLRDEIEDLEIGLEQKNGDKNGLEREMKFLNDQLIELNDERELLLIDIDIAKKNEERLKAISDKAEFEYRGALDAYLRKITWKGRRITQTIVAQYKQAWDKASLNWQKQNEEVVQLLKEEKDLATEIQRVRRSYKNAEEDLMEVKTAIKRLSNAILDKKTKIGTHLLRIKLLEEDIKKFNVILSDLNAQLYKLLVKNGGGMNPPGGGF